MSGGEFVQDPDQLALIDFTRVPSQMGDVRSVTEILLALDHQARMLPFHSTPESAPGRLMAWPGFMAASRDLWDALPHRDAGPPPPTRAWRIAESVAHNHGKVRQWPPPDTALDPYLEDMTAGLEHATRYVAAGERGGWEHENGEAQLRATIAHSMYLVTHAVGESLHSHDDFLTSQLMTARTELPSIPDVVRAGRKGIPTWRDPLEKAEAVLGSYLDRPTFLSTGDSALTPDRLATAVTTWVAEVERVLALDEIAAADLAVIAHTQGLLTYKGAALVDVSADRNEALIPRADTSERAWSGMAETWRNLAETPPMSDGRLVSANRELVAALRAVELPPAPLTPEGAADVAHSIQRAWNQSPTIANHLVRQAARTNLVGPAGAIARWAENEKSPGQSPKAMADLAPLVAVDDVLKNRTVPLPARLHASLQRSAVENRAAAHDLALATPNSPAVALGPAQAAARIRRHLDSQQQRRAGVWVYDRPTGPSSAPRRPTL